MKKKYLSSKVEWEYISQLLNAIDNQNIRYQVGNALEWYVIKASRYRLYEYALNALTLVVPATLLILNKCVPNDGMVWQSVVAVSGTFAGAAKSFSKLHDKRVCYRRTAEFIKSETVLFINNVGIYENEDSAKKFVNKIIRICNEENNNWAKIESKPTLEGKDIIVDNK